MRKLSTILSENFSKPSISLSDIESFDELLKRSAEINEKPEVQTSFFKQEHVETIESDEIMQNYLKIADIVDAFTQVSKYYAEARETLSWHDNQIVKYLSSIQKYIDQLASYISIEHKLVHAQLNLPQETFDNKKALASILKQSDEWKDLKKLLAGDLTLRNQSLTGRGIGFSIIAKTKSFIKIIN